MEPNSINGATSPEQKKEFEPDPAAQRKGYATPRLTAHGKLIPLTLGGSLTDG